MTRQRPAVVCNPRPYYASEHIALHLGDCLDVLTTLPDASIDAVVTDPPYALRFMGKEWDSPGSFVERKAAKGTTFDHVGGNHNPANSADAARTRRVEGAKFQAWCEQWAAECLRVLKPGGHLVAFGAPRTHHRLVCAVENAGFEVRDSLHWIYGSGMPKGQDVAKCIDRRRDDRTQILQVTAWLAEARRAAGWTTKRMDGLFGFNGMAGHWTTRSKAAAVPTLAQWERLREAMGFDDTGILPLVTELNGRVGSLGEAWSRREVIGSGYRIRNESDVQIAGLSAGAYDITAPASEAALRWQGWNTQLKPAHEPIVLARKSTGFDTTVANVLRHGTGALNIDGCRTPSGRDYHGKCTPVVGLADARNDHTLGAWTAARADSAHDAGRWPTNVLFCHGPECVEGGACQPGCPVVEMDRQSGTPGSSGVSRFFPVFRYQGKAPSSERPRLADGTSWPTVKPLPLMRWLVRLITPPGGVILDPFAGTGTTLEAALAEGFTAIGIEREKDGADLCVQRLAKPRTGVIPGIHGGLADAGTQPARSGGEES